MPKKPVVRGTVHETTRLRNGRVCMRIAQSERPGSSCITVRNLTDDIARQALLSLARRSLARSRVRPRRHPPCLPLLHALDAHDRLPVPFQRLLLSLAAAGSRRHRARTLFSRYRPCFRRAARKDGVGSPLFPGSPPCLCVPHADRLCLCPVLIRPRPALRLSVILLRHRCCPPSPEWEDAGK